MCIQHITIAFGLWISVKHHILYYCLVVTLDNVHCTYTAYTQYARYVHFRCNYYGDDDDDDCVASLLYYISILFYDGQAIYLFVRIQFVNHAIDTWCTIRTSILTKIYKFTIVFDSCTFLFQDQSKKKGRVGLASAFKWMDAD